MKIWSKPNIRILTSNALQSIVSVYSRSICERFFFR